MKYLNDGRIRLNFNVVKCNHYCDFTCVLETNSNAAQVVDGKIL